MLAAASLVCSQCGNLRSICSDPSQPFHPQESVCWSTAAQQWGIRRLRDQHKNFDHETRDSRGELVMSPLEGVTVWVSDIDFEELAEGANSGAAGPQEADGE